MKLELVTTLASAASDPVEEHVQSCITWPIVVNPSIPVPGANHSIGTVFPETQEQRCEHMANFFFFENNNNNPTTQTLPILFLVITYQALFARWAMGCGDCCQQILEIK